MITTTTYQDNNGIIAGKFFIWDLDFERLFIKEIWDDKYYFANGFEVKAGMKVLDIGGHIGTFSVLAEKMGADVVAFEPILENYKRLLINLNMNECTSTIPVLSAIGKNQRFDYINIENEENTNRNTGTSYIGRSKQGFHQEPIVVLGIHEVLTRFGDFDYIKLDCEGSEYEILESINFDLFPKIKYLTMEFHGGSEATTLPKAKKLQSYLEERGFQTFLDYAWGCQGRLQAKR